MPGQRRAIVDAEAGQPVLGILVAGPLSGAIAANAGFQMAFASAVAAAFLALTLAVGTSSRPTTAGTLVVTEMGSTADLDQSNWG